MSSPRQAFESEQRFEVHFNSSRMTLFFLGSLVFAAGGIWVFTFGPSEFKPSLDLDGQWREHLAFWVLMLLLGIIALKTARSALDWRPQIVLTPSGFSWREWSEVEIPWSEIVEIGLKQNGFVRYISLTLRDPARYRADSLITRFFWYFRIRRLGHIAVPLLGLNRKPEDILEAVKRFRDGAVRRA